MKFSLSLRFNLLFTILCFFHSLGEISNRKEDQESLKAIDIWR